MSLKPTDLGVGDRPVALKASLGYEKQLHTSRLPHTVLGTYEVTTPTSGTYTTNAADNAALASTPQELMAVLADGYDCGGLTPSNLVLTLTGTDQTDAPLTGTATFKPPSYANDQSRSFPRGWAAEFTATAGKKFKTVTTIALAADAGLAELPRFLIIGVPSLTVGSGGNFTKIAMRTTIDFDPRVPMPVAIQDGRDKGAQIKKGEIDIGALNITCKVPSDADGLSRINGQRVTGWLKDVKEEKLHVMNIFLLGLIVTAKGNAPESAEPVTLTGTGMYEIYAMIPAF